MGTLFDFPKLAFRPRPNRRFIISSPYRIVPSGKARVGAEPEGAGSAS
jgi:hypothetical protein